MIGCFFILGICSCAKIWPKASNDPNVFSAGSKSVSLEELSNPGKNHSLLDPLIGKWKVQVKYWADASTPPEITSGTSEIKWIFGQRFVQEIYRGKSSGKPYQGLGLMGYDPQLAKFISIWIDSLSTGVMISEGTSDQAGKSFTFKTQFQHPSTGEKKELISELRLVNPSQHVFELFEILPDGKRFKTVEMIYSKGATKR